MPNSITIFLLKIASVNLSIYSKFKGYFVSKTKTF